MAKVFGLGAKSRTGILILKFKMAFKMATKNFFLIFDVKSVRLHLNAFFHQILLRSNKKRIMRL